MLTRLVLLSVLGCACSLDGAPWKEADWARQPVPVPILIEHVNVIDVEQERVIRDQSLLLADGRIREMGPSGEIAVPVDVMKIDGGGLYAVPGLADMHVHMNRSDISAYLDAGVTTVRNLWGYPDLKTTMRDIELGDLEGPTIYAISPGLDAAPQYWPYTQFVESPEDAVEVVQRQVDDG